MRTRAALVSVVVVGICGCGDDGETAAPAQLTAASYNGGLAFGFVVNAEQRSQPVADGVAALAADAVCVQEIWDAEHVALLQSAAEASLPNRIFIEPDPGVPSGDPACTEADLTDLEACVNANCGEVCVDELVSCVLASCGAEYQAIPPDCQGCLQTNIGNPLETIKATCLAGDVEYLFGGSFGIGVLSRHPISSQEIVVLESTTNRRGIIYAELETELGRAHFFCTHLTAVFDDIPYPKPTGSWEEEQVAQIEEMLALVDAKAGGELALLAGDFNTGPPGSGYVGEVEANYQLFLDAGFTSPYVDAGNPCTFCADNPIVAAGSDDSDSVAIDHVLVRGFAGATSAQRILDGTVEVEDCDGDPLSTALSDHYGVSVTLAPSSGAP